MVTCGLSNNDYSGEWYETWYSIKHHYENRRNSTYIISVTSHECHGCIKLPATRLYVQQVVQDSQNEKHQCSTLLSLIMFFHRSCNLLWRHNGHDSVSNHQPHDCLFNHLFRCRSKKTPKLCVTGLCAGNSPGTGESPAQMASNAENVSIWWRHHVTYVIGCQLIFEKGIIYMGLYCKVSSFCRTISAFCYKFCEK